MITENYTNEILNDKKIADLLKSIANIFFPEISIIDLNGTIYNSWNLRTGDELLYKKTDITDRVFKNIDIGKLFESSYPPSSILIKVSNEAYIISTPLYLNDKLIALLFCEPISFNIKDFVNYHTTIFDCQEDNYYSGYTDYQYDSIGELEKTVNFLSGISTAISDIIQTTYDISTLNNSKNLLENEETKFRRLVENSTDIIMRFDKDYKHIYVSPTIFDLFGMTSESFIGRNHQELGFPLDLCEYWEDILDEAFKTGKESSGDFSVDGQKGKIYVDWKLIPEFGPNNEVNSVLTISRNITDSLIAEQSIREKEFRLKTIAENAPGIILELDEVGNILYAGKLFDDMNMETILTKNFLDYLPSYIHDEVKNKLTNVFNLGIKEEIESFLIFQHDESGYFLSVLSPLLKENKIVSVILTASDITERILMEEALRKSEAKFRSMIELAPLGIAIIDKHQNIDYINSTFIKMFGYTIHEIPNIQKWWEIAYPDNDYRNHLQMEWNKAVENSIKNSLPIPTATVEITCKNQSVKSIELFAVLIEDKLLSIFSDITDKKLAKAALEESKEKFEAIFKLSPMAIGITEFDRGNYIDVNDTFLRLAKCNKSDILNKTSSENGFWTSIDDRSVWLNELKSNCKVDKMRIKIRNYVGDYLDVVISSKLIEVNSDKFVMSIIEDVTEATKASEALQASALVSQSIPSGLFIYKFSAPDYLFLIDINPAAIDLIGINPEEYIGKEFLDIWHGESGLEIKKKFLKVVYTSETYYGQDVVFDGDQVKGAFKIVAFKISESKICVAFEDISAKLIAERELLIAKERAEENESKLQKYIDFAPEAVFLVGTNGAYLSANPAASALTGFSTEELCKMNIFDLIPPGEIENQIKHFEELTLTGKFSGEFNFIRKDEEIRHWIVEAVKLNDSQFLSFAKDITPRKKMELELIKAKEQAEQSDMLKTSFLQNMSHEIRTPLNGIMGFSSLLRDFEELDSAERTEFIEMIINSSKRLLAIVDDVLQIARMDTGLLKIKNSWFAISDIFQYFQNLFTGKINDAGLIIRLNIDEICKNRQIYTDKDKLYQIISNLFNNAIKFTGQGFLEFGCAHTEHSVEFYLRDSGIGIKKEYLDNIFERFWQYEAFTDNKYGGTGLGLSISKGLANLLGAEIRVESEFEIGSIFYVSFPKEKTRSKHDPVTLFEYSTGNIIDLSNYNILIVDDEEMNYLYLKKLLNIENPSMLWVKNGRDAIEAVSNNEFDLVLLDLKMPVMNGFEAARRIKLIRPELPIIAQTAYSHSEDIEEAIISGCSDFISKPIDKKLLMELIKNNLLK